MDKLLIIVNPISGGGKGGKSIFPIEEYLRKANIHYDLQVTTEPGDAEQFAMESVTKGYTKVVAAGGDGTIQEVITGFMRAREGSNLPALGVLTVGRGNDFAYSAGVLASLKEELTAILKGETKSVDVGVYSLNNQPEQYFVNGIGIGIEPLINKAARDSWFRGAISYVAGACKVLLRLPKPYDLTISTDDEEFSLFSQQLSIGNGSRVGGLFKMTPRADMADGLLDFSFALRLVKGREIPRLVVKFLRGTQVGDHRLGYSRDREIVITANGDGGFACHADGEHLTDNGRSLRASLISKGIELITLGEHS